MLLETKWGGSFPTSKEAWFRWEAMAALATSLRAGLTQEEPGGSPVEGHRGGQVSEADEKIKS